MRVEGNDDENSWQILLFDEGNDDENSWQILLFESFIKYVRSATTPLFAVI